MAYFKFTNTEDGDEDPIFVAALDEATARRVFRKEIGDMPASMLIVEEVDNLPKGEEPINS